MAPPRLPETFGQALYRLRRARGLSMRRLDALSGVSYSYLSMLEVGLRSPSPEIIDKIATAMQLSPDQTTYLFLTINRLPPGDWSIREDGSLAPA
jgi:transcriptional regulator with XRE-family HTH domain